MLTQRLILLSSGGSSARVVVIVIAAGVLRWLDRHWVGAGRCGSLRRNLASLTDDVSVATSRVSALGIGCGRMP